MNRRTKRLTNGTARTRRVIAAVGLVLLAAVSTAGTSSGVAAQAAEKDFITNPRQVTFEGRRAGEGYFSPDGSLMIFQSEREPGNPFYQIYVMDLELGDIRRVSPGIGKTTCAWIHPSKNQVLYASTHADSRSVKFQKEELAIRASGKERRYAWDYDESYEVYVDSIDGGKPVNVTRTRGYDAEGSFSPDGKLIAFSSNRHAYTETLTDAEKKRFEIDKAYFLDLYIMNADGSNVRRLTHVRGYDGGPFFSPDGKRICFRRFNEKGDKAEVYTIGIDGKDEKRLTTLHAMSWAPFYHPSGDYLIFTTNLHGFANFELYLVDAQARSQPVRVTTTAGFDGLPVFLPCGKRIAWTSTRNGNEKGQIFFGDWNDKLARRLLGLDGPKLDKTADAIRGDDIALHVRHLASEEMAGRATGSVGERLAGDYIARVFAHLGLEPAGDDGTYFQTFTFSRGVKLGPKNELRAVPGDAFAAGRIWRPLGFSKTGVVPAARVVFAGYGLKAAAVGEHPPYDSFSGVDVKGAWVMVLDGVPTGVPESWRAHLERHANLRFKAAAARNRGACGMIVVRPLRSATDGRTEASGTIDLPVVALIDGAAAEMTEAAGRDLGELRARLDRGEWVDGFVIPDVEFSAVIDLVRERGTGRNVLARLNAGQIPIASAVVFGAHYDHLGRGESGNSLARGQELGQIHFGADDNASGVAGVLEAAQYLAAMKRAGRLGARRDIVFAAWSGEEIGLLGSTAFVRSRRGLAGGDAINPPIAACLNLDMIGRLRGSLVLQGVGSSPVWPREIERRNAPVGLPIRPVNDCFLPTDATPFYMAGVPILSANTGAHADYHSPRDTADRVDAKGAARVTKLMALIARGLVVAAAPPAYVEVPFDGKSSRSKAKVALGTMPDYGAEVVGAKLAGVRNGSPAEKAGVKSGDIVVALAGIEVTDLRTYMEALDAMTPGKPYPLVVLRDGKRMLLTVTPEAK